MLRRTNSGTSTWYSSPPTRTRTSSSSTRVSFPLILVSMVPSGRCLLAIVVTQGGRQRVGDVVRLRHPGQPQLGCHRVLHLLLRRPAVARDRLLDPRGGVTAHRQ